MPDRALTPGQSANAGCPFFVPENTELSRRQRQALSLAAFGRTDGEIALRLGITRRTVRAHLQNARNRLAAINTTHAVAIALYLGLIEFDIVKVN